jgi:hypothetical protein
MTFFQQAIPQGDNVDYLKTLSKKIEFDSVANLNMFWSEGGGGTAEEWHAYVKQRLAERAAEFVGTEADHYELMQVKTILKQQNDKYVAVSAMQKAIRRGNMLLAFKAAHSLHAAGEWQNCWRRLAVIALEDIGLGAPDVTAMTLYLASNKLVRDKLGWKLVLAATVTALCRSLKSRALTYAAWWGSMAGKPQLSAWDYATGGGWSSDKLFENMAMNQTHSFDNRLAAYWYLIGGSHDFAGIKHASWGVNTANQFISGMNLPPILIYLMLQGRATANDALYIPIPLVHEMMMSGPVTSDMHEFGPGSQTLIGNKYAACIDQYTQLGKQAISYFMKKYADLLDCIPPNAKARDAVMEAVFFVDGGVLDRVAVFPGYWNMYWSAYDDWSELLGLHKGEGRVLLHRIHHGIEKLNEVRAYLAAKA